MDFNHILLMTISYKALFKGFTDSHCNFCILGILEIIQSKEGSERKEEEGRKRKEGQEINKTLPMCIMEVKTMLLFYKRISNPMDQQWILSSI